MVGEISRFPYMHRLLFIMRAFADGFSENGFTYTGSRDDKVGTASYCFAYNGKCSNIYWDRGNKDYILYDVECEEEARLFVEYLRNKYYIPSSKEEVASIKEDIYFQLDGEVFRLESSKTVLLNLIPLERNYTVLHCGVLQM